MFEKQSHGFYIDIGALHPYRFSNTYLFYLKGWRGINIDAMPGSINAFKTHSSGDINLEIPVLEEKRRMVFYQFDEPTPNGFSDVLSKERK